MKLPISLIVITLNEERNIERCIRSVPFASDILVVDSKSQDQTRQIASSLGARVIEKSWSGYGPQKKFATEQATQDWILSLDADEVLSPELAKEIQDRFSSLNPQTGYEMPRKSWHLGRWIRHGGWYPDYQLRLYHRQHSQWPEAQIHERVQARQIERFQAPLLHYVFLNLADQVETNNRYSSLLAEKDFNSGKKFSLFKLIVKPWTKFMETYFLKLGFLDGQAGFIISISAAYSIFLRWAKMAELQRKKEEEEGKAIR
ncbi:MAG: glycosyltransferase family 2 protein [Pseudobdellovibrionaceae bacterium]